MNLSLVHTVAVMAILDLEMPLPCEHLRLMPLCPFVTSAFDDSKIMKIMLLPSQCERALTVSTHNGLFQRF